MAGRVTVKANFKPLAQLKLTTKPLMKEIGLLARERILRRTAAGHDEHDQPFQPYSAAYAKQKALGLGSANVNLQVSGGMLNAIVITEITEKSVTLGFSS